MKVRQPQPDQRESRGAVALTVVWMLTCLSTAAGMAVVLAFRLLILTLPVAARGTHPLARISGVLLFVAVMTGALCLLLTPLVHLAREIAPPRAITIGALLIGLAPIVTLIVLGIFA